MCSKIERFLLLFGTLCLVSQAFGQENRISCGRRRVKSVYLIHNGVDAKAGHWPWHATVSHQNDGKLEYACGGSIVDESTILTAAHCVHSAGAVLPANRLTVHVGRIQLQEDSEYTQKHSVQEVIQALVRVVDALTCIASNRAVFGTHLTTEMFCGKGQPGVSACNGDSGGGMYFEVGGKWFVRGIVSFTPLRPKTSLCDPTQHTAYTDVAKHFKWIVQYIDQRVLSFDTDILEVDYEEKLRLFNYNTCGIKSFSYVADTVGTFWTLPWLGIVRSPDEYKSRCVVTLISEWYAVGPALCFENDGIEAFILVGNGYELTEAGCIDRNGTSHCGHPTQKLQIQRIIKHPKYGTNSSADNIALIEFLNPADTTKPNVKPICMPVTPELRTYERSNLHVATIYPADDSMINLAVTYVEPTVCMKQYSERSIVLNLENKRICAKITSKEAERNCSSLVSGSPLQEMKLISGTERYFLRGFELLGSACQAWPPSVYSNGDAYFDWILYNMRYNEPDRVETNELPTNASLEAQWAQLQQEKGKEKLRLFNMSSCGIIKTLDVKLGPITVYPWMAVIIGIMDIMDADVEIHALGTLIHERYLLTSAQRLHNRASWRSVVLGMYSIAAQFFCEGVRCDSHPSDIQDTEIKRIIIHPNYGKDSRNHNIALVEIVDAANVTKPYISPVCMPFMEEFLSNKPLDLVVTSNEFFNLKSKKLTELSPTICQRQLAQEGFLTSAKNIPWCAVDSNTREQSSFLLSAGSPLQASFRFDKRERYFLRGVNLRNNLPNEFPYLPELFTNVGRFLDWILDTVQQNDSSQAPPNITERIHLPPVRSASKQHLFDFNSCGINTNVDGSYGDFPIPWMGNLSSNAPFFNKTQCSVTLISEWYAVGLAACFNRNDTEHYVLFGSTNYTSKMECAARTPDCNLPIQRIPVRKVIIHPQYSSIDYSNDIALIQMANRADTSLPNQVGKFLLLFALLCVVGQTNGQGNRLACGRRQVKSVYLIHNGIDAKEGHWPWHAAIFHKKPGRLEYACGGSIIDETTILTAAHCVYSANAAIATNLVSVHVGQLNLNEKSEYIQKHGVQEVILHPGYGSSSIINDIAILKLSSNITMTKFVQPVCLWTMDSSQELIVGRNGTIVGFGLSEEDVVSNQLKQALVRVVDALTCIASDRAVFGTHLTSDIFCGGGHTSVSACNGDSGGGMFFEVGGKWYVRGIVSFTPLRGNTGLCDPAKYTAFTDSAKYFSWIEQYVDQRVLSFESDILDVDYVEKLRLFDFNTCGLKSNALAAQGASWTLPWLGFVTSSVASENIFNTRCVVTLVSSWYAVGPAHCFLNDGVERWIMLGGAHASNKTECFDRNGTTICTHPTQSLQIERIITHPKYDSNDLANNIVLIEFLGAADTTKPNVKPICIAVTPELRTNQLTNLSVASYSPPTNSYVNEAVSNGNTEDCMSQYADLGLTISWKNMRFCAQTTANDETSCSSLRSGAPLQELRSFSETERYFLRGFELFGLACSTQTPPIYNNIDPYIDWMLYNMQYSVLDRAENVSISSNSNKQSLDSQWAKLLQQQGKQNLRLFNKDNCGVTATRNENLGRTTIYPWAGFLQQAENVTDESSTGQSIVVLISEWYALAPRRIVDIRATWRMVILGKYNPDDPTNCFSSECEVSFQFVEIKNIIVPPKDQTRQMLALIELLEPADLKIPYISPICLPFMEQLLTSKPTELRILFGDGFNFPSKKLTMVDYLNCQQRLLLAGHFVTFNGPFPCAIEAEKQRQVPLFSTLGSPLQRSQRFGGRTRYFLYGFDTNEPGLFADLTYGPYLFGDVQLADLEWVLETVEHKMYNESSLRTTKEPVSGLVHLQPLRNSSKSRLFDFSTCGINAVSNLSTVLYPMPWVGNVFSNAPFFNVSRCSVTLINEWYAVGPAYCFGDDMLEHFIVFGVSTSSARECSDNNRTAECLLPNQRIKVQKVIMHPQYNRSYYSNEIALVQLAKRADTSLPNVKPICLPILDSVRSYDKSSLVMASTTETIAEFAITEINNRYIDWDECQRRWRGMAVSIAIDNSKICILTKRSRDEDCIAIFAGASLHSVQQLNSRGRHFLRGFSSVLTRGCSYYYPIIYLDTDRYLDWMIENMDESLQSSGSLFDLTETLIFN
uniref:Peptidase S1 domain-containing protein n=1 Tax=Anopheles dirus TaxID=7168 RepID=A0A182MYI8_9DIPT